MRHLHTLIGIGLLLLFSACGGGTAEKPPYEGIKLGKPYEVYGRWYKPHYEADYDEIGKASWYGPGFHGGKTASGEQFDQNALTAAHKTLPMPSIVRVTNLDNGKSVLIKINDRGPFARDRILDLSRAAAAKLGVIRTGTAKVRVQFLDKETRDYVQNLQKGKQYAMQSLKKVDPDEAALREEARQEQIQQASKAAAASDGQAIPAEGVVENGAVVDPVTQAVVNKPEAQAQLPRSKKMQREEIQKEEPADPFSVVDANGDSANLQQEKAIPVAATTAAMPAKTGGFFVQAATFKAEENAQRLCHKLNGLGATQVIEITMNERKLYRVVLGPYVEQEDARKQLSKLAALGISNATIFRN